MSARRNWIAVASAEHVAIGHAAGFMQVCHGKAGPLRRIRPGDRVVYYSSVEVFGGRQACRAFTAIGTVTSRAPYQVEMATGFFPYRLNVDWWPSQRLPIQQVLQELEFSRGKSNWAAPLRFGICQISEADMDIIAAAMLLQTTAGEVSQAELLRPAATAVRQSSLAW